MLNLTLNLNRKSFATKLSLLNTKFLRLDLTNEQAKSQRLNIPRTIIRLQNSVAIKSFAIKTFNDTSIPMSRTPFSDVDI